MNEHNTVGGKGTGLLWLCQHTDLGFSVPEFEIIDTSYYDEIKRHQKLSQLTALLKQIKNDGKWIGSYHPPSRLEERCNDLIARFTGRDIAIRSSAVISEDSTQFSGAGIYKTYFIKASQLHIQNLVQAILSVYESVDTPQALRYRTENQLGEEHMAVIIQEVATGDNGVALSRLPAREGIIPIIWSSIRGAAVSGDRDAEIHKLYFTPQDWATFSPFTFRNIFESDTDIPYSSYKYMSNTLTQLIARLRERYERDFELEFTIDFHDKNSSLNLLQIRPLTNVRNIEVTFPNKEPILTADYCMGVGEYIGRWITPRDVEKYWDEPLHYAFVTPKLEKMMPGLFGALAGSGSFPEFAHKDYDEQTPNKKALVITNDALPGMHALTVANEKGILCVARREEEREDSYFQNMTRDLARAMLGSAIVEKIAFDIPIESVGNYIHIVSDGLQGNIYRASKEEAQEFEKRNGIEQVSYSVSDLLNGFDDNAPTVWSWSFRVVPSVPATPLRAICDDFIQYMKTRAHRKFEVKISPARNSYRLKHPKAEFEIYSAWFDPSKKQEGIYFSTGRSAREIAKKETTKRWLQGFIDRVRSPDYDPNT